MTPVYQTILSNVNGNCLAACWASLLHLEIDTVPNFVERQDDHAALCEFLDKHGYEYSRYIINPNRTDLEKNIKDQYEWFSGQLPMHGSVDGYYEATVLSPGYFDNDRFKNDPDYKPTCHAVIVDQDFNVVHDPNPKYKNVKYPLTDVIGYNGVIGVSLYRKIVSNEA